MTFPKILFAVKYILMSHTKSLFEMASSFIKTDSPATQDLTLWVCMDDRPLESPAKTPYKQIGGAVHGAATDFVVMAEIAKKGTFLDVEGDEYSTKESSTSIPEVAKKIHLQLLSQGVLITLHDYCAAEGSASDINTNIIRMMEERPEVLINRTKEFFPHATEKSIRKTVAVHKALADQGMFRGGLTGITRVPLVRMQHTATMIIADHIPGALFNPAAAVGENIHSPVAPAYHVSFGSYEELFKPLMEGAGLTLDREVMLTASAVRHAAISYQLPNQPLSVHRIEYNR